MPEFPIIQNINSVIISAASPNSLGAALNAMGLATSTSTYPTANKAYFCPFSIQNPATVYRMFTFNGGTASGNIDVGIYDAGGSRIISSGSTAQSGTSTIQEFDITDTILLPGLYYLAIAVSSTAATFEFWSPTLIIMRALGVCEQASAFALPSSATFATLSGTFRIPYVGAALRSAG